jgi:hypothetical protein
VDHQGIGVRSLKAGDGVGLSVQELVRPSDDQIEGVEVEIDRGEIGADVGSGGQAGGKAPLQAPDEVARGDLDVS